MKPKNTINAPAATIMIEPGLIPDVMNLRGYRKLFAPVIPGLTDTAPIYAAYEQMRQADEGKQIILVLVECQAMGEFREALARLPIRKSSEWRYLSQAPSNQA